MVVFGAIAGRCKVCEGAEQGGRCCLERHDGGRDAGGACVRDTEGSRMDAMQTLGERTFDGLDLGDERRTRRLVDVVEAMCRHPGGTLPTKMNQPKRLRAFYRLMNRVEVTHDVLLTSHANETRRRMAVVGGAAT